MGAQDSAGWMMLAPCEGLRCKWIALPSALQNRQSWLLLAGLDGRGQRRRMPVATSASREPGTEQF